MANYDISEAFEVIEDELISSMMRNLSRHRIEEVSQGMEWEQWQVLQLQALEEYRQHNQKKFPPRFNKLNGQIANALHTSYQSGATSQERQILQAIQNGYKPPVSAFSGQTEITGEFFKTNDRKLNALVNATVSDMSKAEYSILRHTDDQYRQIIFNAQVYANTGAGTYEKAVDMAVRDFLKAGINSIQYKNGSRHTIEEYSRMALQTAMKRAYLQGEGEKRKEFGIPTVMLKKRTCACPKCLPFVGKVFIDDVWSGGDSSGISPITGIKYPLLSQAIALGLYHPNCRDTHSTYYEGISTPPEDSTYTVEELDEIAEKYKAEQQQSYCENQADRYHRLSKYSLDSDNKRMYGTRATAWDNKAEKYKKSVSQSNDDKNLVESVEKSKESSIISVEQLNDFKNKMSALGVKEVTGFEQYTGDISVLNEMTEDFTTLKNNFPKLFANFAGVTFDEQPIEEYAKFDLDTKFLNFNKNMYNDTELLKSSYQEDVERGHHPKGTTYRANVFHEFGHYIEDVANINPKKLVKKIFEKQKKAYYRRQWADEWVMNGLSRYAVDFDYEEYIAECFAEYFESSNPRPIAVDTVNEIFSNLFEKGLEEMLVNANKYLFWRTNREWYDYDENEEIYLTDKAPEEARQSYQNYLDIVKKQKENPRQRFI